MEKYNRARQATDDSTRIIKRMCIAYWITKATGTNSRYVIINAFPQQLLEEPAAVLRLYVHYLSCLFLVTARLLTSECKVILLKAVFGSALHTKFILFLSLVVQNCEEI